MEFDGDTYDPKLDGPRLQTQLEKVYAVMRDGEYHTLKELAQTVKGSEAGVSARIRDFRKLGFEVESERVKGGLWHYRIVDP